MSNDGSYFLNLDLLTTERYDQGKFMEFTDNYDPLTSSFMNDLISLPQVGKYTVQGEDGKPDLLSYRIYGDTQYWWVLLIYNRKFEFSDIKTGDEIVYPSVDSLEDVYFSLKAKEAVAAK